MAHRRLIFFLTLSSLAFALLKSVAAFAQCSTQGRMNPYTDPSEFPVITQTCCCCFTNTYSESFDSSQSYVLPNQCCGGGYTLTCSTYVDIYERTAKPHASNGARNIIPYVQGPGIRKYRYYNYCKCKFVIPPIPCDPLEWEAGPIIAATWQCEECPAGIPPCP
jgi:hypothetical protein